MKLQIFDVTHGFCAYLVADNGNVMLFDCGDNEKTNFRPSGYLPASGCQAVEILVITNYDHDHVSDLANLRKKLPIKRLLRNKSLTAAKLQEIKEEEGSLTSGLEAMVDMAATYVPTSDPPIEFQNIEYDVFYNDYPAFEDTNNLSLVFFLNYDGMCIVFTGDLEKAGWKTLLKNTSFCTCLRKVNIFIASHHGRESGYCEEVFNYCKPDIVIISDDEIKYDTQEVDYGKHAKGIPWNNSSVDKRYVLTTRTDGMITINKTIGSGYHITI